MYLIEDGKVQPAALILDESICVASTDIDASESTTHGDTRAEHKRSLVLFQKGMFLRALIVMTSTASSIPWRQNIVTI